LADITGYPERDRQSDKARGDFFALIAPKILRGSAGKDALRPVVVVCFSLMCRWIARISPFTASQEGPLARPPLAIPRGTRLRGPSGSLRCSIYRGVAELVATLLRHAAPLSPE